MMFMAGRLTALIFFFYFIFLNGERKIFLIKEKSTVQKVATTPKKTYNKIMLLIKKGCGQFSVSVSL